MILLRVVPSICSLLIVLLLPSHTIAQAGELAFFSDGYCNEPSTVLPKASLELSTCLVTKGADGLVVTLYPACPNDNTARMILYKDSICAQTTKGRVYKETCFYAAPFFDLPSVMFTCDDPTSNPQPTSTLTITATMIAGVATTKATSGATTSKSSAPTTSGGSSPISGGAESSGSSSPNLSGAESNGGSSGSTSSTSSSGLSTSDKIAIGVGLGVGIATILVMILLWLFPSGPLRRFLRELKGLMFRRRESPV